MKCAIQNPGWPGQTKQESTGTQKPRKRFLLLLQKRDYVLMMCECESNEFRNGSNRMHEVVPPEPEGRNKPKAIRIKVRIGNFVLRPFRLNEQPHVPSKYGNCHSYSVECFFFHSVCTENADNRISRYKCWLCALVQRSFNFVRSLYILLLRSPEAKKEATKKNKI